MGGTMGVADELRAYLQVLWRHGWMIAACAMLASLVALGISLLLPPVYTATATLRVASAPGGATDYYSLSSATRLSNTYVEIASSDISLDAVAQRLGLEKPPDVEVEVVPETELLEITASDSDPVLARDVANTLAGLMVEQSVQLYGGSAPTAREILEGQLNQAKADLDSAVSEYDDALRLLQSSAVPAANGTPAPDRNAETLAHLIGVRQQIYSDLLQKYETARTNEQLRANAITIFEPASLARRPASPKVPLNTALAFVAGLVTGVILAFLFEGMDDTVRGVEDVQAISRLPILAQIPEKRRTLASVIRSAPSRDRRLLPRPAFHQLGARLLLAENLPMSSSLLVTSPEPGTGKSTVAANLAITLAGAGQRVTLIDMDCHRPRLHSVFGMPNERGLSDCLCGSIPLSDVSQDTPYPNLRIVTSGSSTSRASEWLAPAKIRELLDRLEKECDLVLVDAPALLSVADSAVIASLVDTVVLVVARHGTRRQHLRLALQQLAELRVEVVGIVLNKVPNSHIYGYYTERQLAEVPTRQRKPSIRAAIRARDNGSGSAGKKVDAVS